jgi:hypothetical protein
MRSPYCRAGMWRVLWWCVRAAEEKKISNNEIPVDQCTWIAG